MRTSIAIMATSLMIWGCGNKDEAIEQAEKEHQQELKDNKDTGQVAKTIKPPVANRAKLDCTKVIDPAQFTTALGETEPVTVRTDTKNVGADGDAAAICSVLRGGKRPTMAEQDALLKKKARLGTLPGDPLCQVSLYCYTFEDEDHLKKECVTDKDTSDDTMGSYSCLHVNQTGQDDQNIYTFFDADTKCRIKVGPGGSNINNDQIRLCAKAARDSIGPDQIKVQ
jgi:hypothetical protein